MAKEPNWKAIKAEYLKGGTSYRKLAAKYKVNESTLTKRAIRESWSDGLQQTSSMVAAEMPAKVAEVILDEAADWVRETLSIAKDLRQELKNSIKGEQIRIASTPIGPKLISLPTLNTAQDIKALASALADIDKTARQALGLDKKDEQQQSQSIDPALAALANGGASQPSPGVFTPPGAEPDSREP